MSGTSVATPIAVGMAAIILAFLNKTNVWKQEEKEHWLSRTKERRVRSTTGMRRVLEQMCRDRNCVKLLLPRLMWERSLDKIPLAVQTLMIWHGGKVVDWQVEYGNLNMALFVLFSKVVFILAHPYVLNSTSPNIKHGRLVSKHC